MLTVTNPVALFWNAVCGTGRSTSRAFGGFRRNEAQGQQTTTNAADLPLAVEELFKAWESSPELRRSFFASAVTSLSNFPLDNLALLDKIITSEKRLSVDVLAPVFVDNFLGLHKKLTHNDFCVTPISRRKRIWKVGFPGTNHSFLAFAANKRHGDVIQIQTRGFRTRVSVGVGQDEHRVAGSKGRVEDQKIDLKFAFPFFSFKQKPLNVDDEPRLTRVLAEAPSDVSKKSLKDAFIEGYKSGTDPGGKAGAMRKSKIARLFIVAVFIYLFWPVLSEIVKGRSGLFRTVHTEVNPEDVKVTFNDVKAIDEAKAEVKQIVEYLKDPERFCRLGARLPKGVLLVGPPGTGKTLLARAIAGEAGVPFFRAAGSEFEEMLVGQGARRVRELFGAARRRSPCVIFIDEIDSCGSKRTSSTLHPYANQMINQLLSEMDGFEPNEGVIVLAATNRRDDLDPALMRPGRFDVEIHVSNPDLKGRQDIFKLYLSKIVAGKDVDVDVLSRRTVGFSGADIESMVNQAALKAATDNKDEVNMTYLEAARHFVIAGPAKARIPDEQANQLTAYHEAGHALVAYFTPDAVPLDRATIIPRGGSLGHTSFIPEKEQYHQTRSELLAALDAAMGGRAAEELIYGNQKVTTGAASDLKKATDIATMMVKQAGMSEKVGLRTFDSDHSEFPIIVNELSPSTSEVIDNEIKRLLQESYERAKAILKAHSATHKRLAEALLQNETLDFKEIKAIIDGESLALNKT